MTPESCGWAVWIGAAPWIAQHFYRHYQYTGDEDFLRDHAYPFLKEVVAFYEDYFVTQGGELVIVPSQSPENRFAGSGDQYPVSICVNSAMDLQLAQEVFTNAIQAAHILDVDAAEAARWEAEPPACCRPRRWAHRGRFWNGSRNLRRSNPVIVTFPTFMVFIPASFFRRRALWVRHASAPWSCGCPMAGDIAGGAAAGLPA